MSARVRPQTILVCFAVKEEGRYFQLPALESAQVKVLFTGIGKKNTERALEAALATQKPDVVLTCGFAGGLNPAFACGTVLFCAPGSPALEAKLALAGARAGK